MRACFQHVTVVFTHAEARWAHMENPLWKDFKSGGQGGEWPIFHDAPFWPNLNVSLPSNMLSQELGRGLWPFISLFWVTSTRLATDRFFYPILNRKLLHPNQCSRSICRDMVVKGIVDYKNKIGFSTCSTPIWTEQKPFLFRIKWLWSKLVAHWSWITNPSRSTSDLFCLPYSKRTFQLF